ARAWPVSCPGPAVTRARVKGVVSRRENLSWRSSGPQRAVGDRVLLSEVTNMRLTLAGKLIVLLVVASAIYFAWTRLVPPETRARLPLPGQTAPHDNGPPAAAPEQTPPARTDGAAPSTAGGTAPATTEGTPPNTGAAAASNEILFVTTAA